MRDLDVPVVLLHVLEALELQREDHRQLLHAHPLLRLLVAAAVITLKFIITTEGFRVAEAPQAVRDGRVLVHVHLQVEEVLVFAADGFAVEAARLAGQHALENLVDPRRLVAGGAGHALAHRHAVRRDLRLALVPLREDDFVDVIDEQREEFVRVLLHVIVELLLLLPQPRDEFLRRDRSDFLLLRRNRVKPETEPSR